MHVPFSLSPCGIPSGCGELVFLSRFQDRGWENIRAKFGWSAEGGCEVSVNGEAREGARCEMLDDKGVRVSLKWTLFKFKCGGV